MGWGGESKRCEGEQKSRREGESGQGREGGGGVLLLLLQMRAVGTGEEVEGGEEKGASENRSENNRPILCPEDRRCCLLTLRVRREEGGLTITC